MLPENVIEVRNVQKSFKVYPDRGHSLKEKMMSFKRNKYEIKEVLRGVSFDVRKGESIGLIGHNGCGKSTMLKMLTRIMYPDQGTIEVRGRVSSLLELGAGFHPDMSGRDNIYINASIFGMTRKEINAKIKDIVDFSELGEYIDNPVRTYSSGMYMRLAFAVAINVNADILIVDEILAVGDINFQRKCLNKMREIQNAGTTVVLVSHSMDQIRDICDRSIWIQDGRIMAIGNTDKVAEQYLTFMSEQPEHCEEIAAKEHKIESPGSVDQVKLWSGERELTNKLLQTGDELSLTFHYHSEEEHHFLINIEVMREDYVMCYTRNFDNQEAYYRTKDASFRIDLGKLPLFPAQYFINLHIVTDEGGRVVDEGPLTDFLIRSGDVQKEGGAVRLITDCKMAES